MLPTTRKTLTLAAALLLFVVACSGTDNAQDSASGEGASATAEAVAETDAADEGDTNTVVVAVNALPDHLNTSPWGGLASHIALTGLGSQLVGYDKADLPGEGCEQLATGLNTTGRLAESVEINDEGTAVVVTLPELQSPYGNTLSAEDVKFSIEHGNEHQPVGGASLARAGFDIEAEDFITIVDDRTVELKLAAPTSMSIEVLQNNLYNIMDSTEVLSHATDADPLAIEWLGTNLADYSGWELENFTPGTSMTLVANPDWGGELSNVDRLQIQAIPDTSTRLQLMVTGEADMANGFEYDEWLNLSETDGVTVQSCQSVTRDTLMLQTADPSPFADERVRRALSMATDREALITGAYSGFGTAAASAYPSVFELPNADESYTYNPERARELLAEAGYADGFSFELTYTPSRPGPVASRTAVLLQSMYSDVGIDMAINEVINTTEAQSIQQEGRYEAILWSEPGALTDPGHWGSVFLTTEAPSNTTNWGSAEYDSLMEELKATPLSEPEARTELMGQLAEIVDREVPILYLVEVPNLYAFSDDVLPVAPETNGQVIFRDITAAS